jgi:WD40 repeat protein
MLEAGIVRVLGGEGQVLGGGFLAGPEEVVTCAHVVAQALGLPDGERPSPDAEVWLDFPLVALGEKVAARVAVWQAPQPDNTGDIAGLSLAGQAPAGVKATRLVIADDLWSHRFRLFGFPAHHDQGVWVSGRLRGRQAAGWVQMEDSTAIGYRVEPGFSGTPVWDDELDGVVGMAVAAEARPEVHASYLIPASTLVRAWPGIADQARPPCPYRGLFAFREQDAALFFGREETSDQLLGELTRRALVAVVGPSGSGKSSLVFAGAVPRLRQRQDWVVAAMRPARAASPLTALAAALQPLLEPQMSETQRLRELAPLEAVLEEGRLLQVVDRALAQAGGGQLLLVIDQFEELYALEPEVTRQFVDVIVNAAVAEGRTQPLTIVLTLRADFLSDALQHARFASVLQGSTLVIGQMTRDQLHQAIARPLSGGVTFEAGLIERILDDVGEEPGNLPLLEFALTLLWDRQEGGALTHAGYDALGGVDGAIARYAEQVYLEELSPADREAARRLLVQLVEPGLATAQIRRVARRTELDPIRWQLAQRLATARLLVASRDSAGVETVELVHEALIPGWGRLREWMDIDHAFRAWQERLRDNVKAWQGSGRDTGGLLRGVALAEAERWLKERADDLGPAERHYIEASRAFQGRSLRRLRVLSGGLAVLMVAALIFGVLTVRESRRAETQSRLATSRYLVSQAEALEETRPDLAILLSVEAFQTEDTRQAADLLVRMANDRRDAQALLTSHASVEAVAFNPTDARMLVSADPDNGIVFWDVVRRARVATVRASGVSEFVFSPDGHMLASGGSLSEVTSGKLNEVRLWDPRRHRALGSPLTGAPDDLLGLTFSPDGRMLAGCGRNEIVLWDLPKRALRQRIKVQELESASFCRVGFTSHGRYLAYASGGRVVTWDIARQAIHRAVPVLLPPNIFERKPKIGDDFTVSPDGNVAMLTHEGPILWDLRRAALIAGSNVPIAGTSAGNAAFSQDSRTLAYTTGSSTHVIDVTHGISTRVFTGHKIPVGDDPFGGAISVALSPDGQMLAVGGRDGTIALVQADSLGALPVTDFPGDSDAVFTADGRRLLTATIQDGIQAWDVARRTRTGPSTRIEKPTKPFGNVALSPDGRLLAVQGLGEKLILWDVERRIRLGDPLRGVTGSARSLAFSPDGRILAWADDRNVILWDVARRTRIAALPYQTGTPSLAFSPDGHRLAIATGAPRGRVVLWDVAHRPAVTPWVTGGSWSDPVFSPDGRWLAIDSSSGISLWDVPKRKLVTTLPRHDGAVFSPDSRLLAASVSTVTFTTGEVAIWNVESRARLATLDINYRGRALRFSPDSKMLATISDDGLTLQRFDTSWAARHLCQIVHRDMTAEEWNTFVPGRAYHRTCT